jgi:hypothetical protein
MALSVIGAGFGRTGTLSLKMALDQLGVGPCYHMSEVFKNPAAPQQWLDAAEGRPVDWDVVFKGYRSTVDWPSATFYRQLADVYPDAKVILTLRDPNAWFESTQATIFARDFSEQPNKVWADMANKVVGDLFDRRMHDREHLISVYERHNAEVRRVIPASRLLVYEVARGWEPLCAFLGVPAPAGPMPRVNSREDFAAMVARARTGQA